MEGEQSSALFSFICFGYPKSEVEKDRLEALEVLDVSYFSTSVILDPPCETHYRIPKAYLICYRRTLREASLWLSLEVFEADLSTPSFKKNADGGGRHPGHGRCIDPALGLAGYASAPHRG